MRNLEIDALEQQGRGGFVAELDVLERDLPLNGWHHNPIGIIRRCLLGVVDHITQAFQREGGFLHGLPDGGHAQDRACDIASDHSESDQLTKAQLAIQYQRGASPDQQKAGELIEKGAQRISNGADNRVIKTLGNEIGVEILPFPAAAQFDVLRLHGHHAAQHLDEMALGLAAGHRSCLQLLAHNRRNHQGETDQKRNHGQGKKC